MWAGITTKTPNYIRLTFQMQCCVLLKALFWPWRMDSALPLRWILVSFVRPPSNWLNGPFCTFQAAKHRWRKWSQCFHCHFLFHNLGGRKGHSSICSLHWLCCWHHRNQSRKPPIWCSVSILCLRPQAEVSGTSVRLSPAALRAGAGSSRTFKSFEILLNHFWTGHSFSYISQQKHIAIHYEIFSA